MRNIRRNVDKISRSGFVDKFKMIAPAKAGAAANDINNSFEFAMMVWARLRIGMNNDRSGPELTRTNASV